MALSRVVVFVDGQNIYHAAKEAWCTNSQDLANKVYTYPSYDIQKLSQFLVDRKAERVLQQIRFYTGVPHPAGGNKQAFWHGFWSLKLRGMGARGIYIYKGRVNRAGQEKGVDVSIAIDVIKLTYEQAFDVALVLSQDADFGPAIKMSKEIAKSQGRKLGYESAFPKNEKIDRWWVPGTEYYEIRKAEYDACLDPNKYLPSPLPP